MKHALLTAAVLTISSALLAQQPPTTTPATVSSGVNNPAAQYPIPYAPPTAESVTHSLSLLRDRIEQQSAARFVDRKTGKEVTDLSKPSPDVVLDAGPERRFVPVAYPMGVIYSGLLSAGQATGDPKYNDFVAKRFQFLADHVETLKAWGNGRENPFRNLLHPGNLDACGAMVASMTKAKRLKVGTANLDPLIEIAVNYVHTKQQRLDDGTFCRPGPFPQSLWLDDAYMSVPLLANYAAVSGKTEYFDDAAKQIKGFYAHLFRPNKELFTHAGNMANPDNHPDYCWGRANGWFMVATVELLDLLPGSHPDRPALIKILQSQAKGAASYQSGVGLWHQVLDRTDSYLESSVTAMFTYSMAKGVNRGWLDARAYAPVALAGWNGLSTKLGPKGEVNDVCIGTNYADDMVYYYHRPATDDWHGYGPALLAGSEILNLLKNPKIHFSSGKTNPNLVSNKGAD